MDIGKLKGKDLRDYICLYQIFSWRREAIASHYEILASITTSNRNSGLFFKKTEIWSSVVGDADPQIIRIVLEPGNTAPLEGELQLTFLADDRAIASLTFLFVYGDLIDYNHSLGCIVGSLQGRRDTRAEVRHLSKLNHEISPFAMLLLALRSICQVLSADKIVGVPAWQQVALRGENAKSGLDYDAIWEGFGGVKQTNGFYLLQNNQHCSQARTSAHRRRAARKAEHKLVIIDAIASRFHDVLSCKYTKASAPPPYSSGPLFGQAALRTADT